MDIKWLDADPFSASSKAKFARLRAGSHLLAYDEQTHNKINRNFAAWSSPSFRNVEKHATSASFRLNLTELRTLGCFSGIPCPVNVPQLPFERQCWSPPHKRSLRFLQPVASTSTRVTIGCEHLDLIDHLESCMLLLHPYNRSQCDGAGACILVYSTELSEGPLTFPQPLATQQACPGHTWFAICTSGSTWM